MNELLYRIMTDAEITEASKPSPRVIPKYEDLGCLNTMFNSADLAKVDKCRELKHLLKETKIGNCYYRETCETCKITYTIDSSD